MKIDLHIHTIYSDGCLTPKDVIDIAAKHDVKVISIADHDTIEAYSKELFEYANNKNVKIIPAVEISTKSGKAGIHVLGYNFSIDNKELIEKLQLIRNSRYDYLNKVEKKLTKLGYIVDLNKLNKLKVITKAHIADDIIENPNNRKILINNFKHIPSKGEFIETILNEGCIAFVDKTSITPKEASEIIKKAGGKVVLAHPIAYEYEDGLKDNDILKILNEMNADGLEANYIYVDKNNVKHDEINKWNAFAKEHNLNVTIGSDFHGDDKIRPTIGFFNEKFELTNLEATRIINWILS